MHIFQQINYQTFASLRISRFLMLPVFLLVLSCFARLSALGTTGISQAGDHASASVSDTSSVEAAICAGDFYTFGGEELTDPGTYTAVFTAEDGSDSTVVLTLTVLPVPVTELAAVLCEGTPYEFGGQTLTLPGKYVDTLAAENGCDSLVVLELTYVPSFSTTLSASICAGEFYLFGNDTLRSSGVYVDSLVASGGCDSVVALSLKVLPVAQTNISAGICEGSIYVFQGDTLKESGVYAVTLEAENGCDSTVTLTLDVVSFFETPVLAIICEGETYLFGGAELTESGLYTDSLKAAGGCDSTILLTLKVLPPTPVTFVEAVICANEQYVLGNDTLTESGEYTVVLEGEFGCDSTVTLTLSVLPVFETQLEAVICSNGSYEINGESLTEAGDYTYVFEAENGCDSTVNVHLEVLPVPVTPLEAAICAGDSYEFAGESLTEDGTYTDILVAENGCDSLVILELTVLPTYDIEIEAVICANETFEFNGESLNESGVYAATFTAENGCDSTVTLTLSVLPLSETVINATICSNETYEFDGESLNEAGTYTAVYEAENGCDSTVVLVLAVLPTVETNLSIERCNGLTYLFDGQDLTESGTYSAVFAAENGCDSLVTLALLFRDTFFATIEATICAGDVYDFNGQELDESGEYEALLAAAGGCDSLVSLILTVLPVSSTDIEAGICAGSSYEFNGENWTESGVFTATLTAENGCDSTITLTLTVLPNTETVINATICSNETYEFEGEILDEAGTYTATFTAENGCDSILTLVLDVLEAPVTELEATICSNETYAFEGETLDEAGTYTAVYEAENGCDSTVVLILTVLPVVQTNLHIELCKSLTYTFDGQDLSESGIYTASFTAENGCDSLVTLDLLFRDTFFTVIEATICAGEMYNFNGEELSESGEYAALLTADSGCDSIVSLLLTILPEITADMEASICDGSTYEFNGNDLMESGVYTGVFSSATGCDSTVTLTLTLLPVSSIEVEATVCAGSTYEFNGDGLTESGVYTAVLANEAGCDSTVTLTLVVLSVSSIDVAATVCAGSTYEFNGDDLTESGVYSAVLINEAGCDSTVTLTLVVLSVSSSDIATTVCAGTTYEFNGDVLTESGVYAVVLANEAGCDSTVNLTLTVLPVSSSDVAVTVCAGSTYEFNGDDLTESGEYTAVQINEAGCDSTVTLTLTVLPVSSSDVAATVCAGSTYEFNGDNLTESGVYSAVLINEAGCDSTVNLTLTVLPENITNISAEICSGESYPFAGQNLTAPGVYSLLMQDESGCDSLVVLALSVFSVDVSVTLQGITLSAGAVGADYQWFNCADNQPIAGANGSSFTPAVTGTYAVQVTQNGCTAISGCVSVTIVSTSETELSVQWQLAPNPASDFTMVRFDSAPATMLMLEVYDLTGRLCLRQNVASGASFVRLDLAGLPDGMLLIRLTDGRASATPKRLLKLQD